MLGPVRTHVIFAVITLFFWLDTKSLADELSDKHREVVRKGLEYLKKQQFRDGHWEAAGGQFSTAMTGMAGTVFLMEGSTIKEGKYSDVIRRAVDYCFQHSQRNGLIGEIDATAADR